MTGRILPLSSMQRRMWLALQQDGAEAIYTTAHALRLHGQLDRGCLRAAFDAVLRTHPMLRAAVVEAAGRPVQRIAPAVEVDIPVTDLSGLPPAARDAELDRLARAEVRRPFDLAAPPLFRTSLVRLTATEHVLLMPVNHLIADGLSLRVVSRDLLTAYGALVRGERPCLPEPTADYRDFVASEHGEQAEARQRDHVRWWTERLAGKPPLLTLPTDRPRTPDPCFRGLLVERPLPACVQDGLAAAARRHRTTPFAVYSAALHVLLARRSGQDDITIGFPFGNRQRREHAEVVGNYINTLLQRIDLGDDPTGTELVARVHAELLAAVAHPNLRFEKLTAASRPMSDVASRPMSDAASRPMSDAARATGHHPVFQVLASYIGKAPPLPAAGGLRAELMLIDNGTARFDLELNLRYHGDRLVSVLRVREDLYDRDTALDMVRQLETVLAGLLADPDRPVSTLPLLDDVEVATALAAGTGPATDSATSLTVPELIADVARRHPDRTAVACGGESITYRELVERASAVAARLHELGVDTDDVVAVHADRSVALVVTLVGILTAGAAYLPLDPQTPPRRLATMLADAQPVAVLHDGPAPELPDGTLALPLRSLAGSGGLARRSYHPASLAYVIFTSGSTGRPKGVQNNHGALRNRLRWMQDAYHLDEHDAVLQKTPLTFDVSVWELFWPLITGARLVLARPGGQRDPAYLAELIRTERITVLHFVPSMLRAFLTAAGLAGCPSLRTIVCSGEALPPGLRDEVLATSGAELHNLYGPTEAAIDVTAHNCRAGLDRDGGTVPIGLPISGLRVHVLDRHGEPVPPGVVGELHIGGVGLARGYAGRPDLTADRFVPDPHGQPGGRLYRTGDLARRRRDGVIEFLGRDDGQVKLRGFRIELGEIESVVQQVPGVRQCVVTTFRDGAALAGYVVPASTVPADTVPTRSVSAGDLLDRVRAEVDATLPTYMAPSSWTLLPELPLLSSGKVDRNRLPEPELPRTATLAATRPLSATERELACAWERVLGSAPGGPDDDFFLSGGDSIRSIELVVAARAAGLELTVDRIFRHPTLAAMATAARRRTGRAAGGPTTARYRPFELVDVDAKPDGAEDAFPLSALLSGLVFESRTNPRYRVYTTSLRLAGELSAPALREAARLLLHRHPFLRTSVDLDGHREPVQLVHSAVPDPVEVVDLTGLAPAEREAEFGAWFERERDRRFDWSRPPLLALTAHLMAADVWQLTMTEPYLDGWSVALAMTELLELYRSVLAGKTPTVTPVHAQAEFLRRERAALASEHDRDWWTGVLADPPPSTLPVCRDSELTGYRRREVPVDATTSARLLELASRLRVSVKSVLLAAHVQVVSLLTGRLDVVTGLMSNSRPETAHGLQAVGMFLNTTPLRVRSDAGSGADLVNAVHAAEAAALPHRAYPYAQMLRDSGLAAPFDTIFNFTRFRPYQSLVEGPEPRLLGIRATDQTYHPLTAQFRLDVVSGAVAATIEFSDLDLDEAGVERVIGWYAAALRSLADRPDKPVTPLDQLMGELPGELMDQRMDRPTNRSTNQPPSVFELFRAQAERTPAAEALRVAGRSLSYAELAGRASALGHELTGQVRRGDLVGVCIGRSAEYVTAVLAVLRAGAAYVPLDPEQPPDRLAAILAAAGNPLVLTTPAHESVLPSGTRVFRPGSPAGASEPVPVGPGDTAVVVFTSGSTGTPKGVVLPHRAVANRLRWSCTSGQDVYLLRTPIGFVDSIAELFDGLVRGAPTVVVPDAVKDPGDLVTAAARAGATRITMVPTVLREILRLDRDLGAELAALRHVHVSGEALDAGLVAALRSRLPHVEVHNVYGSTEVCADATAHLASPSDPAAVPVGTPLPGVTAYVLHEDGGLAAPGVPGQLAVGGAGLATGYLDDPGLTADRFVPAPAGSSSGSSSGERVYLTGDLAVLRDDGVIELRGRLDRQLTVRGVRIEPAEIEAALTAHPAVAEALATGRELDGRPVLVGYVRTTLPSGGLAGQLRPFLRDRLPAAALPDAFVAVEQWPRLPSGKIDQRRLPPPVLATGRQGGRPPSSLVERELAALWHQRLPIAPASVEDDFFDVGGHSLHAITLAAAIRNRLGVPVSVTDVFDRPTIATQADLVETMLVAAAT